ESDESGAKTEVPTAHPFRARPAETIRALEPHPCEQAVRASVTVSISRNDCKSVPSGQKQFVVKICTNAVSKIGKVSAVAPVFALWDEIPPQTRSLAAQ